METCGKEPNGSQRVGEGMDRTKEIVRVIVGAGIGLEEIFLCTMSLEELGHPKTVHYSKNFVLSGVLSGYDGR